MIEHFLILIAACILGGLGIIHLIYTLWANKFDPTQKSVIKSMQESTLVITNETTMWKAWIGFNISHSLGLIVIAMLYLVMASFQLDFLLKEVWLLILAVVTSFIYLLLAKEYWFKIPKGLFLISFMCFVIALLLVLVNKGYLDILITSVD